jgi:D-alanyl-D-alanine carboxypeptidase (penicillin-binding protein 5/6)
VLRLGRVLVAIAAGLLAVGAAAAAPSDTAPVPAARSYLLLNPDTGEVLAQRAPDARLPMASTTKIMTALLTLERASLGDTAVVPPDATVIGGSSARLVAGERLSVRDLLVALLVPSGNDAAITLSEAVGGTREAFVRLMNRRAAALGLADTHYMSPEGLDHPGHYSTVRDLIRLSQVAMRFPDFREIVRNRRATIPGPPGGAPRVLESENGLLDLDGDVDGVKTGHTAGAGYALVAHARRPKLGTQLYLAMIGEPSEAQRAIDAKRMLDWGFSQYARPTVISAGQVLAQARVRDRPGVRLSLRAPTPLVAPIHLGRPLRATVVAPPEVKGPVAKGAVLGRVVVRDGGRVIGRRPLVAATSVAAPSVGERIRAGVDRLLP